MKLAKLAAIPAALVAVLGVTQAVGNADTTADLKNTTTSQMEQLHQEQLSIAPAPPKVPGEIAGDTCPLPAPVGGITAYAGGPISQGQNMVNTVTTLSTTGDVVHVFAGATGIDPSQGQLVIWTVPQDPCQPGVNYDGTVKTFLDSDHNGALSLAGSTADTVLLTAADGHQETFSLLTDSWLTP